MLHLNLTSTIPEEIFRIPLTESQNSYVSTEIRPSDGTRCNHNSHSKLSSMLTAAIYSSKPMDMITSELIDYDSKINPDKSYFTCNTESRWKTEDRVCNCQQFVHQAFGRLLKEKEIQNIPLSFNPIKMETKSKIEISVLTLKELYDDSLFKAPVPIIHNLLHKAEFHLLSATAKTGKTFFTLDLAYSIATGQKFLNHFETVQSKVLILQTEVGNNQLRKRVKIVFGEDIDKIKESVFFVNERIKLDSKEGLDALKFLLKDLSPDLLILDPFYTLHNSNEDSSTEIAPILSDVREVAQEFNIAILMIHHQGKRIEGGGQTGHKHRGSSSFADVPDGSWSLSKPGQDPSELVIDFEMRNIESPGSLRLMRDMTNLRSQVSGAINLSALSPNITIDNIYDFLVENGDKEFSATALKEELAKKFGVSVRTVGTKLKYAVNFKKVKTKRNARTLIYLPVLDNKNEEILATDTPPKRVICHTSVNNN